MAALAWRMRSRLSSIPITNSEHQQNISRVALLHAPTCPWQPQDDKKLSYFQVSQDGGSREMLSSWQAEDGIAEEASLPDPPLLALEVEASFAEMQLLQHLVTAEGADAEARREKCDILRHLFRACQANMERFEGCIAVVESAASTSGDSVPMRIPDVAAVEVCHICLL